MNSNCFQPLCLWQVGLARLLIRAGWKHKYFSENLNCILFTQIFDWFPALGYGYVSARPHSGPMVKQYKMISYMFKPRWFTVHLDIILIAVLHKHYTWLNTLQYSWLNALTHYTILITFNTNRSPYFKHYSHGY